MEFTICFFVSDAWTGDDVCYDSRPYVTPFIGKSCVSLLLLLILMLGLSYLTNLYDYHVEASLPFLLRFSQCLRQWYDTRDHEHAVNACKYISSIVVILFSTLNYFIPHIAFFVLWVIKLLKTIPFLCSKCMSTFVLQRCAQWQWQCLSMSIGMWERTGALQTVKQNIDSYAQSSYIPNG